MPKPDFTLVKEITSSMARVNHAGEYGAKVIYQGQLKYLNCPKTTLQVSHMLAQEERHLEYFSNAIINRKIRPTAFLPFWHSLGFLLGALSAKLGVSYVMLTTDAIEEVIAKHYQSQLNYLVKLKLDQPLHDKIQQFLSEELEHQVIANDYLIEQVNFIQKTYKYFVKFICKGAIYLSTRI